MDAAARIQSGSEVIPLWNAVICLDCEVISNTPSDECPACSSRSLVSLARMLGGSLLSHKMQGSYESESVLFDVKITVELRQMNAQDFSTIIESLTNVIGPTLALDGASFHVNVEPTVAKFLLPSRPEKPDPNKIESLCIEVDNGAAPKVQPRSNAETIDPAA